MVLVFRPELGGDQDVPTAVERVTGMISTSGGEVSKVDVWGRRRLAYPIKRFTEGDYVLTQFMLEPDRVRDLESGLKLNEDVIRHLVVRLDE
jgi:small subunit ribosomal protein S6